MTHQNADYQDLTDSHEFSITPRGESICSNCGLETIEFQNPEGRVTAAIILDWPHHKAMYFTLWNGHMTQVEVETFHDPGHDPGHTRSKQAPLQTA